MAQHEYFSLQPKVLYNFIMYHSHIKHIFIHRTKRNHLTYLEAYVGRFDVGNLSFLLSSFNSPLFYLLENKHRKLPKNQHASHNPNFFLFSFKVSANYWWPWNKKYLEFTNYMPF